MIMQYQLNAGENHSGGVWLTLYDTMFSKSCYRKQDQPSDEENEDNSSRKVLFHYRNSILLLWQL